MRQLIKKRGKRIDEKSQRPLSYEQARSRTIGWNNKPRTNVNSFNNDEYAFQTVLEESTRPERLYPDAYSDRVESSPKLGPWTNTPQFHNDLNEDPYPYVPETEVSGELWEKYNEPRVERYNVQDWIDYRYKIAKRLKDPELAKKVMGLLSEPIFELLPMEEHYKIWKEETIEAYYKKKEQELLEAEAEAAANEGDGADQPVDAMETLQDTKQTEAVESGATYFGATGFNTTPSTGEGEQHSQYTPIADPDLVEEEEQKLSPEEKEEMIISEEFRDERPVLLGNDGENPTFEDIMLNVADQALFQHPISGSEDDLPPGMVSSMVELFERHLMNLREQKEAEDQLSLSKKIQWIDAKEARALIKREKFYRGLNAERLNFLSQKLSEEEVKEIIDFHRKAAAEWTHSKIINFYIEKRKKEHQEEFEARREKLASTVQERHDCELAEKMEKSILEDEKKLDEKLAAKLKEEEGEGPEDIAAQEAKGKTEEEKEEEEEEEEEEQETLGCKEFEEVEIDSEDAEHNRIRKLSPQEFAKYLAQKAVKDVMEIGNDITVQDTNFFAFGMETATSMAPEMAPKRYQKIVDEDGAVNVIEAMWNDGVWEYEDFKSEYRKPYVMRDIRKSREKREHFKFRMENTLKYYHFLRKSGQLR